MQNKINAIEKDLELGNENIEKRELDNEKLREEISGHEKHLSEMNETLDQLN